MTAAPDPQRELATHDGEEWVGGIVKLPMYVTVNGKADRPTMMMWIDAATEMIVGTTVTPPQDALGTAAAHVRTTARSPMAGRPTLLGRIRVASPELADALRCGSLDGVDVVCAPTPELDRAIDSLIEQLAPSNEAPDPHYLGSDVTVEGTAAMFRAAAWLFDTTP